MSENNRKKIDEETDSSRRKFLRNSGIAVGGVLGGLIGSNGEQELAPVTERTRSKL